ncbi:hypothetical protein BC832DRAFT_49784 [Gaertneriomyces semiglobifer]|nr:hypothetical protein BC832DRAFT_49784 [Gaertneriomyces semiglobifer]
METAIRYGMSWCLFTARTEDPTYTPSCFPPSRAPAQVWLLLPLFSRMPEEIVVRRPHDQTVGRCELYVALPIMNAVASRSALRDITHNGLLLQSWRAMGCGWLILGAQPSAPDGMGSVCVCLLSIKGLSIARRELLPFGRRSEVHCALPSTSMHSNKPAEQIRWGQAFSENNINGSFAALPRKNHTALSQSSTC